MILRGCGVLIGRTLPPGTLSEISICRRLIYMLAGVHGRMGKAGGWNLVRLIRGIMGFGHLWLWRRSRGRRGWFAGRWFYGAGGGADRGSLHGHNFCEIFSGGDVFALCFEVMQDSGAVGVDLDRCGL